MTTKVRLQKTSRYFLRHLLPRELLSKIQRSRIEQVLRTGTPAAVQELTLEMVEALVKLGRYRRLEGGTILDTRSGNRFRMQSLAAAAGAAAGAAGAQPAKAPLPKDEPPHSYRQAPPRGVDFTPSPTEKAKLPTSELIDEGILDRPVPGKLQEANLASQVAAILDAIQFEGAHAGPEHSLTRLLTLLTLWFPGSESTLYRFDLPLNSSADPQLRTLEPEVLAPDHPYREAVETAQAVVLSEDDARRDALQAERNSWQGHWIVYPLRLEEEIWGLLELGLPKEQAPQPALDSLRLLGRALSHQVHNHRVLSRVIYVDWLTQVYNRSFFDLQLPLEIERARRNHEDLAMLMLDLDDFKRVNDSLGHDTGDDVLREFGQLLRDTLRRVDLVFRYGGEEFVVMLPRLDMDSAYRAAERLREAIASHEFGIKNQAEPLRLTASLGGAIYPQNALSGMNLFKAADQACYVAKGSGKNRVIFSS